MSNCFVMFKESALKSCLAALILMNTSPDLRAFNWTYGSYTGNATDGRSITGMSFQPKVVIVKSATANTSNIRTNSMPANNSKDLSSASAFISTGIKSFLSNGFTIGTSATVNTNGTSYNFVAFDAPASQVVEGSYTGDGNLFGKSISTIGFMPKFVILFSGSEIGVMCQDGGWSLDFANGGPQLYFGGFNSSGFSLRGIDYNVSGRTYYFVAFNDVTNSIKNGNYAGSVFSDQNISTSFTPGYILSRAWGSYYAIQKTPTMGSTASTYFNASSNSTTQITAIGSTYFTVKGNSDVSQTGVSHYYIAFGNPSSLLPVELSSFTTSCEKDATLIQWSTITELQNDFFTLERSEDGEVYIPIAYVDGFGDSHEEKYYSYTDKQTNRQKGYYYRLKQTDKDGNSKYYHSIVTTCTEDTNGIQLMQSAGSAEILLHFYSKSEENAEISILDMKGRKVWSNNFQLHGGEEELHLSSASLSSEAYILQINGNKTQLRSKLIYQQY